nr:xylulose kinase-1 [Tanacetum cinerariifolium]
MEHYLEHIDYPIWEVLQKGNGLVQVSIDTYRQIIVLPPKTAEEILARERERKARTTLLMAISENHFAKFYKMIDAKEMWEEIKSKFGGNNESKKMQKYLLKQQFKSFYVSNPKGLHKGSTTSSSSTQDVAFVSSDSPNSTNEVSTAYDGSTSSIHNSQKEGSSSYTDDLMYSFANQSSGPQLDHEDLEQVDEFDIKDMDLKWQVAMISTRLKKFYKRQGESCILMPRNLLALTRENLRNIGYKARDNGKRPTKEDEHKAMVTVNREGVDWTGHAKDETEDYALMAYNSSNSGSDTKVNEDSFKRLQSIYTWVLQIFLKIPRDQTSNPTSFANPTPKGRIRRSSKQKVENSHFEENLTPVDTMTDNRTMAKMLRAPTEGCAEAIGQPAGGLKKNPRVQSPHGDLVSKFINEFFPPSRTTNLRNEISNFQQKFDESFHEAWESSELAKLTHAVNQQTSVVTIAMTAMLKQFQSNPPPAQVKAVEEICVTYGGTHLYYQCLTAGGNTFPEYRDNIQGYVSTATGNFNQGNLGYRPQG